MANYTRRDFYGAAVATTISSGISSGDTSFSLAATTGWPTGSAGDFFVVLDRGTANEEKIRCASRTSGTVTVQTSGRGSDGTSAVGHSSGATAEICLTALDLDEANYAVVQTVGKVAAAGDLLYGSAANTLAKLAKGTTGQVLKTGTAPSWATLASTDISDFSSAADARIAAATISKSQIAASSRYREVLFAKQGTLATGTGTFRWYPPNNATIVDAWASVGTAPTGATLIVDVNRTGTTIFSTQSRRPTISISGFYAASGTPDGTLTMTAGTDYLTVDIDQIGSTIAGSDLTVGVRYYDT